MEIIDLPMTYYIEFIPPAMVQLTLFVQQSVAMNANDCLCLRWPQEHLSALVRNIEAEALRRSDADQVID